MAVAVHSEVFYDLDGVTVRSSTIEDVEYLKDKLRQSDIDEVWASHRHTPEEALRLSLERSAMSFTIEDNGKPVGMFGVVPETLLGNKAVIWFLSSDAIDGIKVRFLRNSKVFVLLMLKHHEFLYNYVYTENVKSIEWLRFLGAEFGGTLNIGPDKKPFLYFYFKRTAS